MQDGIKDGQDSATIKSIIILSGKALHILVCGAFFFTKEAAYPVTGKN
jgi:hypothetical protein